MWYDGNMRTGYGNTDEKKNHEIEQNEMNEAREKNCTDGLRCILVFVHVKENKNKM